MKKFIISATLGVLSLSAFAVDEADFAKTYAEKVKPYFEAAKLETIAGVDNVSVRFQVYKEDSKKCLLLLPGRQESLNKYAELVYDINHNKDFSPMNIIVVDHRGQGLSGRMTKNPQIGYVNHFEDYITDLEAIYKSKFPELGCEKNYLMAHSMGGAIGLGFLLKHQEEFKAAFFSAPMWMINTKPYPNFVATMIGGITTTFGQGKKYAVGQGDWSEDTLEQTTTTHSGARHSMSINISNSIPETRVGGVSNKWIFESLKFTKMLRKNAEELEIPMAVMQAGEDTYVKAKGQDVICKKAANCQKYLFPTSFHEVLMEQDMIRNEALAIAFKLFKDNE